MQVTTYRKTGEAVPTPVWFAAQGGVLFFSSEADSGKVKRIHSNPKVSVAPCTALGKVTGPSAEGRARILRTPAEIKTAEAALAKKYNVLRRLYYFFLGIIRALRHVKPNDIYLAVESAS